MTTVKLNREYTIDEILAGLKTTDLPEAYENKSKIGGFVLHYIPGSGANDIEIRLSGKNRKIILTDTPRPADALREVGKEIVKDAVFGSWNAILRNNNPNKELEKYIAAELTRLFG